MRGHALCGDGVMGVHIPTPHEPGDAQGAVRGRPELLLVLEVPGPLVHHEDRGLGQLEV